MNANPVIAQAVPSAITAEYEIGDTLGTGHFSKVKLGVHKQTGEKVAIKVRDDHAHLLNAAFDRCSCLRRRSFRNRLEARLPC